MAELRVIVLPGGQLQIFGDTGSFEELSQINQELLDMLQAKGLPVEQIGKVEQHRDDGVSHVHVVQTQKPRKQRTTHEH